MECSVSKSDIIDVLSKVQGITSHKSGLAITAHVLFGAENGRALIAASDLETSFEGFYPASVANEGRVAVNARKFYEIIRAFPMEDIHIREIDNRWIEIKAGNIEYRINGAGVEEFPEIPDAGDLTFFEIDAAVFKRMIDKTIYIPAATDEKRAHILSVYLETEKDGDKTRLSMVSTDGSRLSRSRTDLENPEGAPEGGFLVPKKGLSEASRFLDTEGTVSLGVSGNSLVMKKGEETIHMRLAGGEFPEYRELLETSDDAPVLLENLPFQMMLKRMSILSSDQYRGIIFEFDNDLLTVTASNPDFGESKEDMAIRFKGRPFRTAFNPRFFIECLSFISDDRVRLFIVDDEHPCVITGEEDETFLSVIMPMKI